MYAREARSLDDLDALLGHSHVFRFPDDGVQRNNRTSYSANAVAAQKLYECVIVGKEEMLFMDLLSCR